MMKIVLVFRKRSRLRTPKCYLQKVKQQKGLTLSKVISRVRAFGSKVKIMIIDGIILLLYEILISVIFLVGKTPSRFNSYIPWQKP